MAERGALAQFDRVGVIGAGTMGSGIALTVLMADLKVVLYDLDEQVLERAREYIQKHLERKQRGISFKYLTTTTSLDDLKGCGYVIEAAPENLSLKQDLFSRLGNLCPPPTILATNTSTLPVTAIAAAAESPQRAAGMHFFNPAPVMPLIEIIQGAATDPETVQSLSSLARKMGKTPVITRDTPGFIVNRVARPFYGEALRILGEGTASHDQIDRIVRQGAGFRMGPFELMDLIGIDINFAATQSVYEQTFGEPRYRPHLIQAQMVHKKALGRKSGKGFYTYDERGEPVQPAASSKPRSKQKSSEAGVVLSGGWAPGLENAVRKAGLQVLAEAQEAEPAAAIAARGRQEGLRELLSAWDEVLPPHIPLLCQCADVTLAEASGWVRNRDRLAGFDGLFSGGEVLVMVNHASLSDSTRSKIEDFAGKLGKEVIWIEDSPGMILPRIISMLANEAAFAAGEKIAPSETIDLAMRLGTNYPKGPLEWAKEIGYDRILAVLEHLHAEYAEERYRTAPLLKRWSRQQSTHELHPS
jgi:3-hydroxybutyryl-CoA dehydrogenase